MSDICRTVVVAIGAIVCAGGCVPIPYPAVSSTEKPPLPLAAPVSADQSIAVHAVSDTEECVIRELRALQPPLRVVERSALPEQFRGVYSGIDERLRTLADPDVQRAIADHRIAYAIDLRSDKERECDFNLLLAAGQSVRYEIRAQILEIPSGRDMGEVVVESSGDLVGLGGWICKTNHMDPGFGLIFFPLNYTCEEMAGALHRYFTSGS